MLSISGLSIYLSVCMLEQGEGEGSVRPFAGAGAGAIRYDYYPGISMEVAYRIKEKDSRQQLLL